MTTHRIYKELLQSFQTSELDNWYSSLDLSVDNDALIVCFPHRYFEDWFDIHVRQRFEQAVTKVVPKIRYQSSDRSSKQFVPKLEQVRQSLPFGSEFVFENFLSNDKNHFPLASARQVAHNKEIQYNPLVLCGASGSGKSFLLRAIANVKSSQLPGGLHVTSIEDLHELYTWRNDARKYLLSMQFLAVDDLQAIVKYAYLQDELMALFDHFHTEDKQLVFACAGSSQRFGFLVPTLKSRLEWGLIVNLQAPDLDIRSQFVQVRCRERGLDLSRDRILYLAQRCVDLRNLEGCLLKLEAYQALVQDQLSDSEFDAIFSSLDPDPELPLTPERIMDSVCTHLGVTLEDMLSTSRKRNHVFARQVAMYLARQLLGLSFPQLGRIFGGKDHSTVLYSHRKIDQLQSDDKNVKSMLQTLSDICLGVKPMGDPSLMDISKE